jgi:hypothetical protein
MTSKIFQNSPFSSAWAATATMARTFRQQWILCGYPHKVHYAEDRIMPTWHAKGLSSGNFALLNSA